MMKIQFCSDLHLEFPENQKLLAKNPLRISGDVLLLAGDIVTLQDQHLARRFFDFACDNYEAVYWVPGNHEYYGSDISDKPGSFCEKLRSNLHLANNQSVVRGNVRFVFTTLWSRINPINAWEIQRSMPDFSAIQYEGENFNAGNFSMLHDESLRFLRDVVRERTEIPTVVVSHHVPTLMNYPWMYKNSPLTEAFAVELSDFIADSGIDCWIYGHHHVNTPEFMVGKTKMLTNQLGYVRRFEHKSFRRDAVVVV